MNQDIQTYHKFQTAEDKAICETLHEEICKHLPKAENKVWHGHPVWFLDGNPIVGYSKLKNRLMEFDKNSLYSYLIPPGF